MLVHFTVLDAFSFPKYVCGTIYLDLCGNKNYAFLQLVTIETKKNEGGKYKLDWEDSTEYEIMLVSIKQHSENRMFLFKVIW